jgi:glycogen debranching enzyme
MAATDDPERRLPHHPPPIVPVTERRAGTVLRDGIAVLVSDELGDVRPDRGGLGLWRGDTRLLSCLQLRVNGRRPGLLAAGEGTATGDAIVLAADGGRGSGGERGTGAGDGAGGPAALGSPSLGILRRRRLEDGLSEELVLSNHTERERRVRVELLLDADMADIFEVQGHVRAKRGTYDPLILTPDQATFTYHGLDGRRWRTRVRVPGARLDGAFPGTGASVAARWAVVLAAGASARLVWTVTGDVAEAGHSPAEAGHSPAEAGHSPAKAGQSPAASGPSVRAGLDDPTAIESDDPQLDRVLRRAVADLDLLMTPGPAPGERYLAAGVPWFATLFGRDAILAAYATLLVDPGLAIATLRVLARLQADTDDPARDAEPGKMVHEIRDGEMARLGEVPFGRYYGASDTTPLWLVLLGEVVNWTGDLDLARELWPAALRALDWLERHGDSDGDGFIEYSRRAPGGLDNQGWKDAPEAIRDRHGRIARGPIALAEVQGYAYAARRRSARLARRLGDHALAARLEAAARRLRRRFDAAFWVADRGYFAIALDGAKAQMDALASNQGHALWSEVVDPGRAESVAGWLAGPQMSSGWGLRTYGAGQPGYTPFGYHTGTVWPHDTALAVAGLRRYGQDGQAAQLADGLLAAGRRLPSARLPELLCGFGSDEVGVPVPYPAACSPQAWAAAAPLLVLRSLLGIKPQALAGRLVLERPCLPSGVGRLRLRGLRVGPARLDLEVRRGRRGVEVHQLGGPSALKLRVRR